MKSLLYIGNKLSLGSATVTTIETLSNSFKKEGFNVISASSKKNKIFRLLDMLGHILKYRNKIDYVLIDTYSTINFYYAYLCSQLCRILKLRYIPILHGGNLPKRLAKLPKLSKQLFENAFVNVAPSLYLKSYFESFGFKNLKYIPNSIEIKNYKFLNREYNLPKLLWVRSFSEIYNPMLAVKVLKALHEIDIQASLCMIGPEKDGSMQTTKKLAEQLGLNVEFTGKLTKAIWHKKAEDYNIFLNTTNIDNTPVSVIEAMALGLPIVSTNVGGLSYLIDNEVNGILVEPDNIEDFKNAVLKLLKDQVLFEELSNNAREKVEQFDWHIVKHKWFSILK